MAKYQRIKGGEKNEKTGADWEKKELEAVCDLYLSLNGKNIHENNPKIHQLANILGRTIRSVENQLLGFRKVETGDTGRENYNKLIPEIWRERQLIINTEKNVTPKLNATSDNEFRFRISSQLKNIIGRDLITDDYIAIFELVKNSYDAHAKNVKIIFNTDSIVIQDDGKGMDREELINKWLFVAYSAKKEGVEDEDLNSDRFKDYRLKIRPKAVYAGAKGIGRFSADRLGSTLKLTTRKPDKKSPFFELNFNWDDYELESQEEFQDISVDHKVIDQTKYKDFEHGLVLEIGGLREVWPRTKILNLKWSLEKLINPFSESNSENENFRIEILSESDLERDKEAKNNRDKVNGNVGNFIFETLNIKTTQIICSIDEEGEHLITSLIDRGILIYKVKEPNNKYNYLSGAKIHLYYLNASAKSNFSRLMGLQPKAFGSVFLFNNGFRVYPFGEPENDPFGIDLRKSQGYARYLGSRELLGRVEIHSDSDQFQETSSRDGGLKRTPGTDQLQEYFLDTLKKLENFVQPILWKISKRSSIKGDETIDLTATEQIIDFLTGILDSNDIEILDYDKNLLKLVNEKITEATPEVFNKLLKLAENSNDKKFGDDILESQQKYLEVLREKEEESRLRADAEKEAQEANIRAEQATKELKEKLSENLFLQSVKSQDLNEIVSFIHHIGISSSIIDNYLTGLHSELDFNDFNLNHAKSIIKLLIFENKKVLNISRFATKANFKLTTDAIELDIVNYLKEYVQNIIELSNNQETKVNFVDNIKDEIFKTFKPIELNILIDNFLSNSKKAGAKNFSIELSNIESTVCIKIKDDGRGIDSNNLNKIFNFGYTTLSGGSGIGLFHVKEIIDRLGGTIKVESNHQGTTFTIRIK